MHRSRGRALGDADAGDVIDVRVGQQNVRQPNLFTSGVHQQGIHLVAGIDQHAFARLRAGNDKTILVERGDGLRLDYDHDVILAIVDDLMFTSKIRTAAKQLGVELAFARTVDAALAEILSRAPTLVILDLNSPRTNPLDIVASMKADAALSGIRTLGFVSHVQTDL